MRYHILSCICLFEMLCLGTLGNAGEKGKGELYKDDTFLSIAMNESADVDYIFIPTDATKDTKIFADFIKKTLPEKSKPPLFEGNPQKQAKHFLRGFQGFESGEYLFAATQDNEKDDSGEICSVSTCISDGSSLDKIYQLDVTFYPSRERLLKSFGKYSDSMVDDIITLQPDSSSISVLGNIKIDIVSDRGSFTVTKELLKETRAIHNGIAALLRGEKRFLPENDIRFQKILGALRKMKEEEEKKADENRRRRERRSLLERSPFCWNYDLSDRNNGCEKRKVYVQEFIDRFYEKENLPKEKKENPCIDKITIDELASYLPSNAQYPARNIEIYDYPRGVIYVGTDLEKEGYAQSWEYAIGIIHADSRANAVLALAYLRLNYIWSHPDRIFKAAHAVNSMKRSNLKIGDECFTNRGILNGDLSTVKGSDEYEIYFIRGNTAAMVISYKKAKSMVETAKRLDKRITGIIEESEKARR